jgi:hypothetical protein
VGLTTTDIQPTVDGDVNDGRGAAMKRTIFLPDDETVLHVFESSRAKRGD